MIYIHIIYLIIIYFIIHHRTFSGARNDHELLILLPLPSQFWDHRPVPTYQVYLVLGV